MKNITNLLQNVKQIALTQYERGFDFATLALANMLNKNLRRLIIKQGKNPDCATAPLLKDAISQELQKRSPKSFHFIGSGANWVKDEGEHPILKSRDRAAIAKFSSETAELLAASQAKINLDDPSYVLNKPAIEKKPSTKKVVKITKKRYSPKTGLRIKVRGVK